MMGVGKLARTEEEEDDDQQPLMVNEQGRVEDEGSEEEGDGVELRVMAEEAKGEREEVRTQSQSLPPPPEVQQRPRSPREQRYSRPTSPGRGYMGEDQDTIKSPRQRLEAEALSMSFSDEDDDGDDDDFYDTQRLEDEIDEAIEQTLLEMQWRDEPVGVASEGPRSPVVAVRSRSPTPVVALEMGDDWDGEGSESGARRRRASSTGGRVEGTGRSP